MTVCFDDSMATMSAQDPVFDTSFHLRLLHSRLCGRAGWRSPCSPLLAWIPATSRRQTGRRPGAHAAAALQEAGLHRRDTNLRICFPALG